MGTLTGKEILDGSQAGEDCNIFGQDTLGALLINELRAKH